MEYVLAIDDTGFATNQKHFETLKSEECCYCSVALRKDILPSFNSYMKMRTDKLFERFGTREFHFTEIYNRRGSFKDIKLEETMDIIRSFAEDMHTCGMFITVSTINKHSYKNPVQVQLMNIIESVIVPNLKLPKDKSSTNLILNIIRSSNELEKLYGEPIHISEAVCDEGLKKSGNEFSLALSGGTTKVRFEQSTNYLLQYADFAAWFVTRAKHILDKKPEDQKEWEKELLYIYSSRPFTNMGMLPYEIGSLEPFDYDKAIDELSDPDDETFSG